MTPNGECQKRSNPFLVQSIPGVASKFDAASSVKSSIVSLGACAVEEGVALMAQLQDVQHKVQGLLQERDELRKHRLEHDMQNIHRRTKVPHSLVYWGLHTGRAASTFLTLGTRRNQAPPSWSGMNQRCPCASQCTRAIRVHVFSRGTRGPWPLMPDL